MDKKKVLVTGANGGIGLAIVAAVARAGYAVVAHYRKNATALETLCKALEAEGQSVRMLQFDVRNREQCKEVLEKDMADNGVYYGVVSNAGICADATFAALSENDWDSVLDTNLN